MRHDDSFALWRRRSPDLVTVSHSGGVVPFGLWGPVQCSIFLGARSKEERSIPHRCSDVPIFLFFLFKILKAQTVGKSENHRFCFTFGIGKRVRKGGNYDSEIGKSSNCVRLLEI